MGQTRQPVDFPRSQAAAGLSVFIFRRARNPLSFFPLKSSCGVLPFLGRVWGWRPHLPLAGGCAPEQGKEVDSGLMGPETVRTWVNLADASFMVQSSHRTGPRVQCPPVGWRGDGRGLFHPHDLKHGTPDAPGFCGPRAMGILQKCRHCNPTGEEQEDRLPPSPQFRVAGGGTGEFCHSIIALCSKSWCPCCPANIFLPSCPLLPLVLWQVAQAALRAGHWGLSPGPGSKTFRQICPDQHPRPHAAIPALLPSCLQGSRAAPRAPRRSTEQPSPEAMQDRGRGRVCCCGLEHSADRRSVPPRPGQCSRRGGACQHWMTGGHVESRGQGAGNTYRRVSVGAGEAHGQGLQEPMLLCSQCGFWLCVFSLDSAQSLSNRLTDSQPGPGKCPVSGAASGWLG